MKIEGIIFDWAGTTIDYGCFAPVQTFAEVFRVFGMEATVEETRKPIGMLKRDRVKTMPGMPRIKRLWKNTHGRIVAGADINAMHDTFTEKLMNILDQLADPKPYVVETVARLQAMGLAIGSTTGYTDQMMVVVTRVVKEKGYAPGFWISPNSVDNYGRPYLHMIFRNLKQLHIRDVHTAVKVGDMISDIKGGVAADVTSVGILERSSLMGLMQTKYETLGTREKGVLCARLRKGYIQAGTNYVVQDMRESPALVQELNDK